MNSTILRTAEVFFFLPEDVGDAASGRADFAFGVAQIGLAHGTLLAVEVVDLQFAESVVQHGQQFQERVFLGIGFYKSFLKKFKFQMI